MRLSLILPFALAGSALAQQVSKAAVSSQFDNISASMASFRSALAATADASGIPAAMAGSKALLATIQSATGAISGLSGTLNVEDASQLLIPSQTLAKSAGSLVDTLKARGAIVKGAGATSDVLGQLKAQLVATTAFAAAVTNKVPAVLKEAAESSANVATKAIQDGINYFSKL
jgi:Hydrophobic surface binding protein A